MNLSVFKKTILSGLVLTSFLSVYSGCTLIFPEQPPAPPVPVEKIILSMENISLSNRGTGAEIKVTATVVPSNATSKIKWESSNTSVVTVDDSGVLRAVALGGPVDVWATALQETWVGAHTKVTVTGMELSTRKLLVQKNYPPQKLTFDLSLPGVTADSVQWTSDNAAVATVDSEGLVNFPGTGKATVMSTVKGSDGHIYTDTCEVRVYTRDQVAMEVGQNFWNFGWTSPLEYIRFPFTQDKDKDGFADLKEGDNIWTSQFLTDLGSFTGPLRFMDWTNTNTLPLIDFSGYPTQFSIAPEGVYDPMGSATLPIPEALRKYYRQDDGDGNPNTFKEVTELKSGGVPYYWIVDICNRSGRDMWINIPTFAGDDYVRKLLEFIRDNLNPQLKVYVEYSNETWNGMFVSFQYTQDKGVELDLPGFWGQTDGYGKGTGEGRTNKYYQGQSYTAYRSLQIFEIMAQVFGRDNLGLDKRAVRVLSAGGDGTLMVEAVRYIIYQGISYGDVETAVQTGISLPPEKLVYNTRWNPTGQQPDMFSTAPYVADYGPWNAPVAVDGRASNIASEWRNSVDWSAENHIKNYARIMKAYGIPYGTYEGGQHLGRGASHWGTNPLVYAGYQYMLDKWQEAGVVLFTHYTLYGDYAGHEVGFDFWGSKAHAGSTGKDAYKFEAIKDWVERQFP